APKKGSSEGRSMLSRRKGWWMARLCLGAAIVVVTGIGGAALLGKLGLERFQSDSARMAKLRTAPLLTIPSTPVLSGDWPQWRGPNRDGVSPETGLLTNWPPDGPRVLWRKPLDCGFSSLAVVGGRLYTMVQEAAPEKGTGTDSSTVHEA